MELLPYSSLSGGPLPLAESFVDRCSWIKVNVCAVWGESEGEMKKAAAARLPLDEGEKSAGGREGI